MATPRPVSLNSLDRGGKVVRWKGQGEGFSRPPRPGIDETRQETHDKARWRITLIRGGGTKHHAPPRFPHRETRWGGTLLVQPESPAPSSSQFPLSKASCPAYSYFTSPGIKATNALFHIVQMSLKPLRPVIMESVA